MRIQRYQSLVGFTIAPMSVLMMVALSLVLLIATIATWQLGSTTAAETREQALYLAEGALAETMSQLHNGVVKGTQFGLSPKDAVTFAPYPERPDWQGQVSFNAGTAWGYSTNNFSGGQSTGWNSVPVPQGTAHIVAHGVCGTAQRTIEAFVKIPDYDFVLACDGDIASTSPIQARAEQSMSAFVSNAQKGTPDMTSPANVGSNGSVNGGANSNITGDLIAHGSIVLGANSTVGGAIRQSTVALPVLQVTSYDMASMNPDPIAPTPTLSGNVLSLLDNTQAANSLTVNGDLNLQNALLYVEGNLTINGALKGTGAVFVHGSVNITGGADLDAQNLLALAATGDVTMTGSASTPKYFQGLVYSEGLVSATDITVAGSMMGVTNPKEGTGTGHNVTLTNAHLIGVQFNFSGGTAPAASNFAATASDFASSEVSPPNPPSCGGFCMGNVSIPVYTPSSPNQDEVAAEVAVYEVALNNIKSRPALSSCLSGAPMAVGSSINLTTVGSTTVYTHYYDASKNQFVAMTPPFVAPGSDPTLVADLEALQGAVMGAANDLLSGQPLTGGGGTPPPQPPVVTPMLELNNFLTDKAPLHIISWREL